MSDTRAVSLVQRERAALADALEAGGPTAPTVLPGWEAADLLEHLLLREQRPDLMIGPKLPVPPLARKAQEGLEGLRALPWADRVEKFRSGPQKLSPVRVLDGLMNTIEYYIHHEDVRRAQPDWEPRTLSAEDQAELFTALKRMGRMLVRADVEITLMSPQGSIRIPAKKTSRGAVSVQGNPSELVLWTFGRDDAQVSVQGEDSAIRALENAKRGV
ncbi:TIGR03085 family metal-binding protein [Brachybacterium muris]|uniref:Uncharacterized protein n=1 Tax=Brachybacterium muris UCD-AY4 TaxID=1249481 RepID=A0A022KX95_9MICO|nr:TIGR03085 family metal-binding protein [Brachybacterium muris]EYT50506.1 hypothetical protein D641_0104370 [Brachybacterium muris UCD-AY4]